MAAQNRSLFAAKCLVETAIAIYVRGYSLDDIKLGITLATITTQDPLKPVMLDVLLTWTAVIMMTLRAVGVPLLPEGTARQAKRAEASSASQQAEQEDRMTQSLEFFVKSCIDKYLGGMTLFKLQLQQSMQGQPEGDPEAQGQSPTVAVLQQNFRLAIITLEVVKALRLTTTVSLRGKQEKARAEEEEEEEREKEEEISTPGQGFGPVGFIDGFLDACKAPAPDMQGSARTEAVRDAAIRLLIAFNGAVMGYLRSAKAFVEELYKCYTAGWTAEEIFNTLHDEEFAQSGGVAQFNIVNSPGGRHITATLFARWVSLSYMTLVQLGVGHPGARDQSGWAWIGNMSSSNTNDGPSGGAGGLEAHAISDFVINTLRNAVASDEESGGDEEARDAGGRRGVRQLTEDEIMGRNDDIVDEEESHEGFGGKFEDPSLLRTSSFALILSQEISLVRLTRLVMLQKRDMMVARSL